ncbi:MAG TPA: hypothetical protein VID73_06730 [Ktedonobacterales bacterium]
MGKAGRAYLLEFGGAMVLYSIVVVVSVVLLKAQPHAAWRIPVALGPVVPAALGVAAFVRFLGRMDDLQRRIQLEALGLAFAATGILTFAYGFLEGVGFPRLNAIFIFPGMVLLWGLGLAVASWRYR